MTLASRLKGLFGISWGAGPDPGQYDFSLAWERGLPLGNSSTLSDPYAQHPTISRGVTIVSEDAASVPWEVYPKGAKVGSDDPIEDHPLLSLWGRPNAYMSGNDLWVATYTLMKLHGEVFWYFPDLALGSRGGLQATARANGDLLVVHSQALRVKAGADGPEYEWTQKPGAPLDPMRITHFRRFDPTNPMRGLSELRALGIEIEADYNAARWNRDLFGDQAGIPAGVVKPPLEGGPVPQKDRDEFTRRWNERHARRRAVGILPPGWDWSALGLTAKDMDFRALREYAREQAYGTLGVPPFLAGILDKANYANAREQKDVYWHGTVTRFLTYFATKINADFLPKIGAWDVEVYPCWEKVKALTENLNEKADIAGKLFAMGFTRRQINERLELGFDADEWDDADESYLPFSLSPVSQISEPRAVTGPVVQPGETNGEARGVVRRSADSREARRTMIWRAVISNTRDLEMRFQRMVRAHMNGIEREVLANVNGLKGWLVSERVIKGPGDVFDKPKAKRALTKASEPLYRVTIQRGAEAVIAELDLGVVVDMTDPRIVGKIAELTGKITRIDDTIESELRASLAEGTQAGESAGEIAARVREVMDASRSRSLTIARTESGQAFGWGRFAEMRDAGILQHEWVAARDDKVREDHQAEDGSVVSIGEAFPVTALLYPLDSSGPPEQIINCRCVAVPVLEGAA